MTTAAEPFKLQPAENIDNERLEALLKTIDSALVEVEAIARAVDDKWFEYDLKWRLDGFTDEARLFACEIVHHLLDIRGSINGSLTAAEQRLADEVRRAC